MNKDFYLHCSNGRVALWGLSTWLSHGYVLRPGAEPKLDQQGRAVLYNTNDVIKDEAKAAVELAELKDRLRMQRNQRAKERRQSQRLSEKQRVEDYKRWEEERKRREEERKSIWHSFFKENRLIFFATKIDETSRWTRGSISWIVMEKGKIVKESELSFSNKDERDVSISRFAENFRSCDFVVSHDTLFLHDIIKEEWPRIRNIKWFDDFESNKRIQEEFLWLCEVGRHYNLDIPPQYNAMDKAKFLISWFQSKIK